MTSSPPLTLYEVELAAKAKLPQHIYKFYASGSDDERALRRNIVDQATRPHRCLPRRYVHQIVRLVIATSHQHSSKCHAEAGWWPGRA
ncbi:hypothetical protein LB505_010049 [Fusarium chuoi]|nr:hypothetical protein LB505_010049 [Fusarium chuoi]